MSRIAIVLFVLTGLAVPVRAQDGGQPPSSPTFSISGQIRHRSELDAKGFAPESEQMSFHLLRTRIGAGFQPTEDVRAFVQIQDARLFGGEDPGSSRGTMDGSADALDVHQAYFAVDAIFGSPVDVKVGRQKLSYGNGRLIGSADWGKTGRTFDAGALALDTDRLDVHVFAAKLVGSEDTKASENLYGAFGTLTAGSGLQADLFALRDNDTEEIVAGPAAGKPELARNSAGTRVYGRLGRADYEGEVIHQWGRAASQESGESASIRASLFSGGLGYTLPFKETRFGVAYTRLSGDEDAADATEGTFNTLFASNHGKYGTMDYFPGVAPSAGLHDIALTVESGIAPGALLAAEVHRFDAVVPVPTATGTARSFGHEVDLSTSITYNASLSFSGGVSLFFPGEAMEAVRGGDVSHWIYLMTTVNF